MHISPAICAALALSVIPVQSGAQDHHASADKRGAMVMGFDQQRTAHHFALFPDGGSIEVRVKNPADVESRDAIRAHLPHIARLFGDGNFEAPMLVHDSPNVPGTSRMAAHKADIRYRYIETNDGGRVDIVTRHPEALAAIHDFLRFQIADHKTGDAVVVRKR
ncbi:MAG TPA: hypothetical protein VFT47_14090 [Vicinamibacterales bacterium]|nr:hypothetical protein [Vicinamibacterales bacterium]